MEPIYEYIQTIYQTGSFKRAAERLHMTQPALSIALKKYEEQIGATVFDRKKHPFLPTPAGEIILRNIANLDRIERKMRLELFDLLEKNTGNLFIGSTHYVNTCVLPPLLIRFMEKYPQIQILMTEKSSNEVVKDFLNDEYDVAFYANRLETSDVLQIPVFQDRLYWVIPNRFLDFETIEQHALDLYRQNPLKDKPPLNSLALLEKIPFIALMPGDRLYEQASALFQKEGVVPQQCLNIPQSTTAWHMACAGIGAALIPETLIKSIPAGEADISIFSFASPLMKRTILAGCKNNQYISTATRKFLDLCRSVAHKGALYLID